MGLIESMIVLNKCSDPPSALHVMKQFENINLAHLHQYAVLGVRQLELFREYSKLVREHEHNVRM
jgi:hypothetical protein